MKEREGRGGRGREGEGGEREGGEGGRVVCEPMVLYWAHSLCFLDVI